MFFVWIRIEFRGKRHAKPINKKQEEIKKDEVKEEVISMRSPEEEIKLILDEIESPWTNRHFKWLSNPYTFFLMY